MTAAFILSELQSVGTPEKAVHLSRFFKTGPGQYGEGDQFLGVVVPQTRSIAKANKATPFDELQLLLDSPCSGDSGDGMQLAGNIFSTVSATV